MDRSHPEKVQSKHHQTGSGMEPIGKTFTLVNCVFFYLFLNFVSYLLDYFFFLRAFQVNLVLNLKMLNEFTLGLARS